MNKILIIIFILIGDIVFSQQKVSNQGIVIYSVTKKNFNISNVKTKGSESVIKKLNDKVNKLIYILKFNENQSSFDKDNQIKRENILTEILVGKGNYFTDLKEKVILRQIESFGEKFIISYPFVKWNLTQETRQINGYKCFKATIVKNIKTRRGVIEKKIVAWYTLELPISFAPKDYSGLPGLIVELKGESVSFRIEKIIFQKVDIQKPIKGKKITLKEYDDVINRISNFRRKKRKKHH